jgi:hypothetical protein
VMISDCGQVSGTKVNWMNQAAFHRYLSAPVIKGRRETSNLWGMYTTLLLQVNAWLVEKGLLVLPCPLKW